MNESAAKLLQQLAQKLGTTTEYLWGVLLKQAPIDATTTLIQLLMIVLYGFGIYKLHIRFSKNIIKGELEYNNTIYKKYGEAAGIPMILATTIFIALAIIGLGSISDIINGYFNPEYWALNKIFSKL